LETDLGSLDSALKAVEKAGVLLQVGFNRRFDDNFRFLHEEIAAERIGRVAIAHIVSRDPLLPGPPRRIQALSGLFFDTTVHDFDMLRFLTGSEIEMVHVQASSAVHGGPDIDTAVILARMSSGAIATIDNSQAVYHYDQRVEVFGTGGALFAGNERMSTVTLAGPDATRLPGAPYFFPQRYRQSYLNQLGAFARSLATSEAQVPSGADGRAATVAALAAQRSFDERRPVRIQEIG
jgi:myo-inositol 2-dehydrogenase/D-chiro-inositol 1-dehydrogenase